MSDQQRQERTRRVLRRLRRGEITIEEAREQEGFPPADPIKEKR